MIGVIDYGLGNISAFRHIYEKLEVPVTIVSSSEQFVDELTHFVLPGVGSFDWAMQLLDKSGMRSELERRVMEMGRPILGVCVGMQILFESSEEGQKKGLGWIPGKVKKLAIGNYDQPHRLPHMGWNSVDKTDNAILFKSLNEQPEFYFLHSYVVCPDVESTVAAWSTYSQRFASSVQSNNIFGTQFHPEKSHDSGIRILSEFGRL